MSPFWQGFLLFPFVLLAVGAVVAFIARQGRAIFQWYIGIPLINWFAMGLLVLALKFLNNKSVPSMRANGRIWLSPRVKFFEDDKAVK